MDKHRFSQLYWKNYISVEKEFMQTLSYILNSKKFVRLRSQ